MRRRHEGGQDCAPQAATQKGSREAAARPPTPTPPPARKPRGPRPPPPRGRRDGPPPARERSRSATRPPAPAAGSHGGRGEQASPRQRARTPHRSRPEKAAEHEPELYGGPRAPWTARRQCHPLCCLPREGRGTERSRATLRPTGPPRPHKRGVRRTPPPPSPPRGTQTPRTRPAARSPHRACRPTGQRRAPTARPVGGQSGEGEHLTPDAPRNSRRHPPRGRPTATPTTPSQVGGNRDRTAPPQARQTEQGTGAGRAEGHGPRGTALPAPSAGTTRGAHATPPRGGGADAAGARAHTHVKGTRGLPEGQRDRARRMHRPRGMAYQRARVRDTRTRRPATRSAEHAGREGGNERDTTPGTGPNPPEPAASAAHTQTGHCTCQGSSGAQRHAPTPRLGSLRTNPRGSHWRQASSTGPAAPAPRATTH